ncbi:MAG: hypothetical protein MJE68_21790 [Proteobacteria bacterium]|nr:hypothetical protein [Pseudomonadota bacterium]
MPTPSDDKQDFQDFAELNDRLDQATEAIGSLARQLQNNNSDVLVARAITRLENELRRQLNSMVHDIVTSLLDGQLGNAGGGAHVFTRLLPRFAKGGVVDGASLLALGGEAGPEAVLPLKRMPDGRLGVVAQSGTQATKHAPPQIIVNLTPASVLEGDGGEVSQGLSDEMAEMITRVIDDAVDTRLAEHQRYGGMLNRIGGERL